MKFEFEAVDGAGRSVRGQLDGENERTAHRALRQRGLTPVSLAPAAPARSGMTIRLRSDLSARELILALKELAELLRAGVPLSDAVQFMENGHAGQPLAVPLDKIGGDLRQGAPLSVALRNHLPGLPRYMVQLVEGGELTGRVRQALDDGVAQMEYEHRLRADLRAALFYPSALLLAGFAAILFIAMVVLPNVVELVRGNPDDLSWVAGRVLAFGRLAGTHQEAILAGVAVLACALALLLRQPRVRQACLRATAGLPGLRAWVMEAETARWSSLLATLLLNQVPLLTALAFARQAVALDGLRSGLEQVERSVRGGNSLAQALQDYTQIPVVAVNLVRLGERAGNLGEMLKSCAAIHQSANRDRTKRLLMLVEPAAILALGGIIGLIVFGLFEAITSINDIPL